LEWPKWKSEKETDEWRLSISSDDFDDILVTTNGRFNLWGHWKAISGHRLESIRVNSAFVSSDRSVALLRALQTAENPHDYRIPADDDELEIDVEGFILNGWIIDHSPYSGLDEQDPWAGAIKYPPLIPSASVIELMNIKSDFERRRWIDESNTEYVIWSQVWGHSIEKEDDADEYFESGSRLQASSPFIFSLLGKLNIDLIVKVEIERQRRRLRWESRNEDSEFILPSARLYLLKPDGTIRTL
jgi:hypothetical protein